METQRGSSVCPVGRKKGIYRENTIMKRRSETALATMMIRSIVGILVLVLVSTPNTVRALDQQKQQLFSDGKHDCIDRESYSTDGGELLMGWQQQQQQCASLPVECSEFFLSCNTTYLNVATLGPTPIRVTRSAFLDVEQLQANTAMDYFGGSKPYSVIEKMEHVRSQAADFIGCGVNETALFESTTHALNTVARGLLNSGFLTKGDVVLTTDQEHAGGVAAWKFFEKKGIISLETIPIPIPETRDVNTIVDDFRQHIASYKGRVKVLAISHVSTTTGATLPLLEISNMAKDEFDIAVIIDGAQGMGTYVNLSQMRGVDAYATSAHKWILSPTGTAILCLKNHFQKHVEAIEIDEGFVVYTGSSGTRAAYTTLGLGHALTFWKRYGRMNIVKHNLQLAILCWDKLQSAGFSMLTPRPSRGDAPIVSMEVPSTTTKTAHEIGLNMFSIYGIVVKMTGRRQFPDEWPVGSPLDALRFTFHMFNSEKDVTTLLTALHNELGLQK